MELKSIQNGQHLPNNKMRIRDIMKEAIKEMPDQFTSNEYCKLIREKGVPGSKIKGGFVSTFLKVNCNQLTTKTWEKRQLSPDQNGLKFYEDEPEIQAAIKLLKGYGFKVMKPSLEWREL